MDTMHEEKLIIYTDGSSLGNPGLGGYGAVIVSPKLEEVVELGGGKPKTTNNEMEMTAVVAALSYCAINTMPITLYTDSKFVINGITKWVHVWRKNGWQTSSKQPVTHRSLWQQMYDLVTSRGSAGGVTWKYVPGHQGVPGNERVDTIATSFSSGKPEQLFRGRLSDYPLDILQEPTAAELVNTKKSSSGGVTEPGYPKYLSWLDGKLETHTVWADCEARVKGKPAKFKKVKNQHEEKEILSKWGAVR